MGGVLAPGGGSLAGWGLAVRLVLSLMFFSVY